GNNSNGTPISGTFDIDNAARIVGNKIDIGADEYEIPNVIVQNPDEYGIIIYPSPAKNIIISMPQIGKQSTITICNITGKELINQQLKINETDIDINNLTCGVYFAKLINDNIMEIRKFIKD
ncbi:MAG: T9SS type A sorting domain-containing protein, partial [Paludibacter sp.]